jgi:hypothetical protein
MDHNTSNSNVEEAKDETQKERCKRRLREAQQRRRGNIKADKNRQSSNNMEPTPPIDQELLRDIMQTQTAQAGRILDQIDREHYMSEESTGTWLYRHSPPPYGSQYSLL